MSNRNSDEFSPGESDQPRTERATVTIETPFALTAGAWGFGICICSAIFLVLGGAFELDQNCSTRYSSCHASAYFAWSYLFGITAGLFFLVMIAGLIVSSLRAESAKLAYMLGEIHSQNQNKP